MPRNTLFSVLLLCSWVPSAAIGQTISGSLPIPQPIDKPPTLSFEQIRDGIRRYYQSLRALEVDFDQASETSSFDDANSSLIPRNGLHFAYKGEKRLASESFPRAGKPDGPLAVQLIMAFDGGIYRQYVPDSGLGSIQQAKNAAADVNAYMFALAIPMSDMSRSLVSKTDYLMPYVLDLPEFEWKVSPRLELCEGVECHVLESKYRQRIWIDPLLGYAMRFREKYWPINPKERPIDQWPLGQRIAFTDYRRVADDVWLPQRIETVQYASVSQPENIWNRPSRHTVLRVKQVAVNEQVADSLFVLSFPPGTMVHDEIRNRDYRIGNSNEELDFVIAKSLDEIRNAPSHRRLWPLVTTLGVLAVLVVILIYRRWFRGSSTPSG